MTNIIFFNHFHNGDIHVSRGFIRQIMNKMQGITFSYSHRNPPNLLSDIPNLIFDPQAIHNIKNEHIGIYHVADTIYVNTWYAQQGFRYMNRYGISMDTLYAAFDDICKSLWQFSLTDISTDPRTFFPVIDYCKFDIAPAQSWLNVHQNKKIFVETGMVLSDQAHNFAFTPIIINLANKHQDKIFILSNQEGPYQLPGNVVYSTDIIKKAFKSDLNENSYLSSHCDVIIGRASGAFTFAMTQENLFQRSPKFIALCNLVPVPPNKFWLNELLRDKVQYSAQFIVSNESDTNNITHIIDTNL
jgi:hypothetical protein